MPWLSATESRVGLGCMRLSTDQDADEERALATIAAAVGAGITVFDSRARTETTSACWRARFATSTALGS